MELGAADLELAAPPWPAAARGGADMQQAGLAYDWQVSADAVARRLTVGVTPTSSLWVDIEWVEFLCLDEHVAQLADVHAAPPSESSKHRQYSTDSGFFDASLQ
jgi:hypothetical protein